MLPCTHPYAAACRGVINAKGDGPLQTAMQQFFQASRRADSAAGWKQ